MIDKTILDGIIIGRVEPHIYAFSTNTIPNYLKVGDTYRPVSVRLKEWEDHYPNLEKIFEGEAKIDGVYFRDFSVHQFLEMEKHKSRLQLADLPVGIYYSKEFFKGATVDDVEDAITDIKNDYQNKTQKYQFYSVETLRPEETIFPRTENYDWRPNQEKTVKAFRKAIDNGRKNLLMYAVMRFGKSFTSMCCAVEMGAKLVVVVSAKADVKAEWKKTVESHIKFDGYEFVTSDTLSHNNHTITERLNSGKKVVVFLTLQDLQGEQIKDKHQEVFGQDIDLLLVDETHFGARAEKYGEVLKNAKNYESDVKNKKDSDDFVDVDEADKTIKTLKANITIHLSGTPYRILMGSEFKKEDIIAFYQFTDIVDEQQSWDNEHILDDECKEWDNPYYGFPQMVRFAFRPNESSRKRLEELRKAGTTYAFSALFKPQSIKKADDNSHKKFIYEKEILDLLEVIDGSKADDELLGFLDYDKLKEGKMCRHIVIVLPYCASCDALEELIKTNKDKFRNLNDYEIVNISGVDKPNAYKSPKEIKTAITKHEENGQKTITLTVNRMLTGSTVPEWDTMLYLKDTASPQEYDQAVFRLQNQYVKTFKDETTGKTIKFNMKPQTLLVDFDPNRMFVMQEKKSKIYNANVDTGGNSELEKRIRKELEISPIITINKDKIERVVATDILEAVSNYQKDKGIKDEALEIPVDLSILDDSAIRAVIELENEIGSKSGLSVPAHDGEDDDAGSELDVPETPTGDDNDDTTSSTDTTPKTADYKRKQEISLTKKVQSYYTRILLFAFITKDTVISLSDIIEKIEAEENGRIAKNLGLSKRILTLLNQKTNKFVLSDLDYKIQDLNNLSRATDLSPAERANIAVNKFGKLGDAIVITPSNICDDMVNLLPEEFIKSLPTTNGKILDIAGTAGEFAVALHKRMTELGLEKDFIANAIYTIPKSSICYELTRKLYEMLELNTANIAKEFVATDLLEVKDGNDIDYDKITVLLTQNKPFETIKLTDTLTEGEEDMIKFEAVVGNPPYQMTIKEATKGNNKNTTDIYQIFQNNALRLSDITCMIYPAKEYQRGKLNTSNKNLLYLRIYNGSNRNGEKHIPNEDSIFGDAVRRIPGDVGIYYFNKKISTDKIIYQDTEIERSDKILPVIKELLSVAIKLRIHADSFSFSKIRKVCESNFVQHNKSAVMLCYDRGKMSPKGYAKVITNDKEGSGGTARWYYIKTEALDRQPVCDRYKIVIGSARPNESFSNPKNIEILDKDESFGRTKVCIFDTDNFEKAYVCKKYFMSKFAQCINLMTPDSFLYYLPNIDLVYDGIKNKSLSNIDEVANEKYDCSTINEVDAELYEQFDLDKSEVQFIESMIKPMG